MYGRGIKSRGKGRAVKKVRLLFYVFILVLNAAFQAQGQDIDIQNVDLKNIPSSLLQRLSPEQRSTLEERLSTQNKNVFNKNIFQKKELSGEDQLGLYQRKVEDVSIFLTKERLKEIEKALLSNDGRIDLNLLNNLAQKPTFRIFTEEELMELVVEGKQKLINEIEKELGHTIYSPYIFLDRNKLQIIRILLKENGNKLDFSLIKKLEYYAPFQGLDEEQLILVALKAKKLLTKETTTFALPFRRYITDKELQAPLEVSTQLKPFGYDLFRRSTVPLPYKPVAPDYIIGPGDEIHVLLWGRLNEEYTLQVNRDGTIFLPQIGQFVVSGMRYDQMQKFLIKQIRRITGTNAAVTLGKLRGIQVFVLGEVVSPGVYNLTPMCTIMDALLVAGGPTSIGSLRRIQLKRKGRVIDTLDLYDLLLRGDNSHDRRLREDDVVFVPPVGPLVAISGEIKRPAVYELKGPTSLKDLLQLAGGPLPSAYLQHVQVQRFVHHQKQIVVDLDAKDQAKLASFHLQDGDFVKVFSLVKQNENVVYLLGNVRYPGPYAYKPGMRVSDLIPSKEDLLPDTYLDYAVLKRQVGPDNHWEYRTFNLSKVLESPGSAEDLVLKPKDTVQIYNKWEIMNKKWVTINGAVNKPGRYEYLPHMRVADLVALAGGLKRFAYQKEAEVVRQVPTPKGTKTEVIRINLARALAKDPQANILLKEEDVLLVRSVPEWQSPQVVEILGEVKFPGKYVIRKGERLSSVLARAGGFTSRAYLRGAIFTRKKLQELQQRQLNEMIDRLERELLAGGAAETGASLTPQEAQIKAEELKAKKAFLARLRQIKAKGRLVVHLRPLDQLKGSPDDIELEDGDKLYVPANPHTIQVVGAVYNQTAFVYRPWASLSYYLDLAGGFTKMADKKEVYVLKVDGTAVRPQGYAFNFRWDPKTHRWERGYLTPLEPGDTIVVPEKLEKVPWLRNVKDVTQILYQIAVTAGVLIAAY